jgi:hypothetical protein
LWLKGTIAGLFVGLALAASQSMIWGEFSLIWTVICGLVAFVLFGLPAIIFYWLGPYVAVWLQDHLAKPEAAGRDS